MSLGPRMTTDGGNGGIVNGVIEYPTEYCGTVVADGKTNYALAFVDACFPDITLSSGETLVRANTSFTRVRSGPQIGWLRTMQINFRNAKADGYDFFHTEPHVFDPPIPFPPPNSPCYSPCVATDIEVNPVDEPVYSQAGNNLQGTVSLTRVKLSP